jgi:tetratricopeptide (TPR) repeat protein
MSGMALAAMLPLLYGSGARLELDGDHPESRAAVCGRWEACQALLAQAGHAIQSGDYALADRRLAQVARSMPDPYRLWAVEARRSLQAALHPLPTAAEAGEQAAPQIPDFGELFDALPPAPKVTVPPLAIDDPFAEPAPGPHLEPHRQSMKPQPALPDPPLTQTLRLARICRELRDYRSASDLYLRGIDGGEFGAAQVITEVADCLARCVASEEEFAKLSQLVALEGHWDRSGQRVETSLAHRSSLIRPVLAEDDLQMEWDIPAGRSTSGGRDRLEYLQRVRAHLRTPWEHVRLCNAMSQALRQIGDDAGSLAWEETLLAEHPNFHDQCAAVLVRRVDQHLARGERSLAIAELRRATRMGLWTKHGQWARHRLGSLLQQQGSYEAAIREFERLVPPPMIDGPNGEIIDCSHGDQGLSASCRLSECYEQLGQLGRALQYAELALAVELSDGRVQVNWRSPTVERLTMLRQRLAESTRDVCP